jgi:hypothetical protein
VSGRRKADLSCKSIGGGRTILTLACTHVSTDFIPAFRLCPNTLHLLTMARKRRATSKAAIFTSGLLACFASLSLRTALAATNCPTASGINTIVSSGTYNGQSTRVIGVTGACKDKSCLPSSGTGGSVCSIIRYGFSWVSSSTARLMFSQTVDVFKRHQRISEHHTTCLWASETKGPHQRSASMTCCNLIPQTKLLPLCTCRLPPLQPLGLQEPRLSNMPEVSTEAGEAAQRSKTGAGPV